MTAVVDIYFVRKNRTKMIGTSIGKLTLVQVAPPRGGKACWYCQCECGSVKSYFEYNLLSSDGTPRTNSTSCGCARKCGNQHAQWTGGRVISGSVLKHYRSGAKRRGLKFELTVEYLEKLFERQCGKCALTGLRLRFANTRSERARTASIDRIDNDLGYIEGNVQWVHKAVNRMKSDITLQSFIHVCHLVTSLTKDSLAGDKNYDPDLMLWKHISITKPQPGSSNPMSKLTEAQVAEIRRSYIPRKNARELAVKFGVQPNHIPRIVRGDRWKLGETSRG